MLLLARQMLTLPRVRLAGLMTIGAAGDLTAFDRLRELRREVAEGLAVPEEALELSMGMSKDYQEARDMESGVKMGVREGCFQRGRRDHKYTYIHK